MAIQAQEITIRVDPPAARAYRAVPEHERRNLDALPRLHLHEALDPEGTLEQVMREISRKAQDRELTPEIRDSILDEY